MFTDSNISGSCRPSLKIGSSIHDCEPSDFDLEDDDMSFFDDRKLSRQNLRILDSNKKSMSASKNKVFSP